MLLQTNSYIVPKEKRAAHNHLMQRFRQVLMKIGCDHFEVFEQVGANWAGGETSGRFVQMMKFRDRKHCQAVQLTERKDPAAQALVREFCELINFAYQEQQGLFAHGYYNAVIEPIRIKPSDLAYHAFEGEESSFETGLETTEEPVDDAPTDDPKQPKIRHDSIDAFSPVKPALAAGETSQTDQNADTSAESEASQESDLTLEDEFVNDDEPANEDEDATEVKGQS